MESLFARSLHKIADKKALELIEGKECSFVLFRNLNSYTRCNWALRYTCAREFANCKLKCYSKADHLSHDDTRVECVYRFREIKRISMWINGWNDSETRRLGHFIEGKFEFAFASVIPRILTFVISFALDFNCWLLHNFKTRISTDQVQEFLQ
jgi:hypothetical protein